MVNVIIRRTQQSVVSDEERRPLWGREALQVHTTTQRKGERFYSRLLWVGADDINITNEEIKTYSQSNQ